tara:strand:+ start:4767 stop:5027 length:261 start_codon:yes stop_codon:yes gene_type:complete
MAHNPYENRHYVIFDCTELGTIDFNQVFETSINTVRKSVNELQTFVKFNGDMPSSVTVLTTKSQEYSYDEILVILATSAWTDPNPQ